MRIACDFSALEALVHQMGARRSRWLPRELEEKLARGVEVPLDEVAPAQNGLLTYQGAQVVIYIKHTRTDYDALIRATGDGQDGMPHPSAGAAASRWKKPPRYHITDCEWIRKMRSSGRYQRYVATRNASGRFLVRPNDRDRDVQVKLEVCMYCLEARDWQGFMHQKKTKRYAIRDAFSLEDFLAEHETYFAEKPRNTDESAPPDGYVPEWAQLSNTFRQQRGWRCEQCRVVLAAHPKLLHCHHRNGDRSDNAASNIAVLCVECHAKQPLHHGRVGVSAADRQLLELLRSKQLIGGPASGSGDAANTDRRRRGRGRAADEAVEIGLAIDRIPAARDTKPARPGSR